MVPSTPVQVVGLRLGEINRTSPYQSGELVTDTKASPY